MEDKVQALEISMAEIKTDLKYIKDSVKQNVVDHEEIIKKIDDFINYSNDKFVLRSDHNETMRVFGETIGRFDQKYAPRMVWTIMCWLGATSGTVVVGGLIYFLVDTFLHINK